MKILITEDDPLKLEELKNYLLGLGVDESGIISASNMAEFMEKFDDLVTICVIDLRIPAYDGGVADTNGIGVLQAAVKKGGGRVKLLAISSFPEEFDSIRDRFESRGCMLVSFEQKEVWQNVLKLMVVQSHSTDAMDFLIFCALRTERAPYTGMPELHGRPIFKENLTRYDITISGKKGSVIEISRMGLVDAASTVATCIERFKPGVIAMSGVCAGFSERATLGQLLISELAYEYQSGKWSNDGFSQEPYQTPMAEDVRGFIRELVEDVEILTELEKGWNSHRPSEMSIPKLAAFTSGSAVIASDVLMSQVAKHHKRVSGLDMEVYAVHRASHIAHCKPDVICAKTVVDLADGDKNDKLHPYGSFISAKFIVKALELYFTHK